MEAKSLGMYNESQKDLGIKVGRAHPWGTIEEIQNIGCNY
jgi:hypothetical protein